MWEWGLHASGLICSIQSFRRAWSGLDLSGRVCVYADLSRSKFRQGRTNRHLKAVPGSRITMSKLRTTQFHALRHFVFPVFFIPVGSVDHADSAKTPVSIRFLAALFVLTVMQLTSTQERFGNAITNSISVAGLVWSGHYSGQMSHRRKNFLGAIGFTDRRRAACSWI